MRTLLVLSLFAAAPLQAQAPATAAITVIDTALARMGGRDVVARVQRVRREMLTQWQRTNFRDEPYADAPSYELHTDIRDYGLKGWRNTRKFGFAANAQQIVDVVVDTVAIRQIGGAWSGLSRAYIDERRELFAIAPERFLLVARDASDLRLGRDTTIDGLPAARLTATVDGFAMTIVVRRGDGLPAFVRFRAAQGDDFGLLSWGEMEVETWYSRWARTASGVVLPTQMDQRRVGRPYKRMSVLSMAFDTVTTSETFAISDSLRQVYFATADRSMIDVPFDSVVVTEGTFINFRAPGAPAGAVKVGGRWVLLEVGQGELSAERALGWLARNEASAPVAAAILTATNAGNGGVTVVGRQRIPSFVAPGARPFVDRMIGNTGIAGVTPVTITRAQWIKVGTDSLWVEPIDLPDAPRTALVYSPTLGWAYSANAAAPLQAQYVLDRIRGRGWTVTKLGSVRGVAAPAPAPRPAGVR
jgi:hypothetical protein